LAIEGEAWVLETPGQPLVKRPRSWDVPPAGFALLEVLGCGVCHTDLGFADGSVRPKQALPIVLGHEIVGRVLATNGSSAQSLQGKIVLAPAVSPCGACPACVRGRPTSCPTGRMPGNDADGGFATHTYVPSRDLVVLGDAGATTLGSIDLEPWQIAPVADAATTAWQALVRAGLARDDVAVFVGAGGVGTFGAELAASAGAHVVAIDVDERRLAAVAGRVAAVIHSKGKEPREVRDELRRFMKAKGVTTAPVRVFETSGHPDGQALAFQLLERGGSLSVVGFTPDKITLRFSNVMALDADIHGNWGCDPALYATVIDRILDGRVHVAPYVESHPLDDVNAVLAALAGHSLAKRAVLIPRRRGSDA